MREKIGKVANVLCAVAVAVIICTLAISYERETHKANQEFRLNLKFGKGDIVDLKIGGKGQIISVWGIRDKTPYLIRIRTVDGFEEHWMSEFEVKL